MTPTTIVVLRHARAGVRAEWTGIDRFRPLDAAGLAQSLQLVEALAALRIDRIWTSSFVRCQQTVTPIAAARRLAVVDRPWLAEGASTAAVRSGLGGVEPYMAMCTHGGATRTIARLLAPDHDLGELAKGAAWVFHRCDGLPVEVEELGPPTGTHELVASYLSPAAAS